jgi:hypothetical protein
VNGGGRVITPTLGGVALAATGQQQKKNGGGKNWLEAWDDGTEDYSYLLQ